MDIRYRVYDKAGNIERGILPDYLESTFVNPLNDLPTLQIHYPLGGVKSDILDNQPEVAVEVSHEPGVWFEPPNSRLVLVYEDTDELADQQTTRYDFIGVGEVLATQFVYGAYGLPVNDEGKVQFKTTNPGKILDTLWANAVARGWGGYTNDFSDLVDSNGDAWANTITISYDVDASIMEILNSLVRQGLVDYRWQGRTLQVFNHNSPATAPDFSGTDVNLIGNGPASMVDAAPLKTDSSKFATHIIVIGENGLRWEFPTGTIVPEGRREVFLTYAGVDDYGTAETMAAPYVAQAQNKLRNITRQFHIAPDSNVELMPFRNLIPGAWVETRVKGVVESLRIRSVSISSDTNGIQGHYVLGDKVDELLDVLYKRVQRLVGSAENEGVGTPPIANSNLAPTMPTGFIVSDSPYIAADGSTQSVVSFTWDHDGKDIMGQSITLSAFVVYYRPSGTQTWTEVFRNNPDTKTATWSPFPTYQNDGKTPAKYDFSVVAVSSADVPSQRAMATIQAMTTDTTPPPRPSTPTASTWLRTITVKWDGKGLSDTNVPLTMPGDFRKAVLYQSLSPSMTNPEVVYEFQGAGSWTSSSLTANQPYYYALKAVDYTGNTSAYSDVATATPVSTVNADEIVDILLNSGLNLIEDPAFQDASLTQSRINMSSQAPAFIKETDATTGLPTMLRNQPGANAAAPTFGVRTNLVPNPSAESANLANWAAVVGTGTVGTSTAFAFSGTTSYTFTATSTATLEFAAYGTPATGLPVTVGKTYTFSIRARQAAGATARNTSVKINWYNSSGALLSTTTGSASFMNTSTFGVWSATGVAPANAAYAGIQIRLVTPAVNDIFYVDGLLFEEGLINSYFDGSFPDNGDYDFSWTGAAYNSTSTRVKLRRKNYSANPGFVSASGYSVTNGTASLDTTKFHTGTRSLKVVANGTTGVAVTNPTNSSELQAIAQLERMTGSVWVYTDDTGVTATAQLYTGLVVAGTAVALTPGVWTRVSVENQTWSDPDGSPSARAFRVVFSGMAAGKTMWVDDVLFEASTSLGNDFNGSTPDEPSVDYSWTGAVDASTSVATPIQSATYANEATFSYAAFDTSSATNGNKMFPTAEGYEYTARVSVYTDVPARVGWRAKFLLKNGSISTYNFGSFASASGKRQVLGNIIIQPDVIAWYPELVNLDNSSTPTWRIYHDALATRRNDENMIVDGAITAAKLRALSVEAGKIAANAVTADTIAAGAIKAAHLEAQLVLASEIVAGPLNDTHASMSSTGFRVYAKDPSSGTVNEVVRLGVANSNDYFAVQKATGQYAATISQDGIGSFEGLNAKTSMYYKGTEMTVLLERASLGIVAWGQWNGNQLPPTIANGTEVGLFELAWVPRFDRMYKLTVSPCLFTPNAGVATAAALRARYTTDGSQPTVGSTIIAEDFEPILANGSWTQTFQISGRLIGGFNGSYIRVLVSIAASNGNGLITELGQSPTYWVEDVGPAYPRGGVLSQQKTGSAPVGTVVATYEVTFDAVDYASYDANGNYYAFDENRMYQGLSPAGYGEMRSMAFFQDIVAYLNTTPYNGGSVTINDMQVYLYFDHWYYNSGGTAKIGVHGHTGAAPSTFNWVGWIMDSGGWPKPGGRWLTIPSQYWAGFLSGQYRGITLGVNTNGYAFYGIASVAKIYIRYTK